MEPRCSTIIFVTDKFCKKIFKSKKKNIYLVILLWLDIQVYFNFHYVLHNIEMLQTRLAENGQGQAGCMYVTYTLITTCKFMKIKLTTLTGFYNIKRLGKQKPLSFKENCLIGVLFWITDYSTRICTYNVRQIKFTFWGNIFYCSFLLQLVTKL